eukprot:5000445-Prymnesium_polylepis.1
MQVGETICTQLQEAASLAVAHSSGGAADTRLLNVAQLLAAWPPTDRGLLALQRALGGAARAAAADESGGVAAPSPLLEVVRRSRPLHRSLTAHVQKVRTRVCGLPCARVYMCLCVTRAHTSECACTNHKRVWRAPKPSLCVAGSREGAVARL